jgi:GNAT superfamily N-acetyltransferase
VLLAHIVSTRCRGDVITDADMGVPKDWRSNRDRGAGRRRPREAVDGEEEEKGKEEKREGKMVEEQEEEEEEEEEEDVGHCETGKTVGLHSLAVLPRLQRCGIGQMIVKAYLDQMKGCGLVRRVALICQDVSFP